MIIVPMLVFSFIGSHSSHGYVAGPRPPPRVSTRFRRSDTVVLAQRAGVSILQDNTTAYMYSAEEDFSWLQTQVSDRLKALLASKTTVLEGLEVGVCPVKKTHLLAGKLPAVQLKVDRVANPQISSSGGATVELIGACFRVPWVFKRIISGPPNLDIGKLPIQRPLRKPMDLHGEVMLTLSDVKDSMLVRRLIERLVNIVLNKMLPLGDGSIVSEIDSVEIKNRRIRVSGRTNGLPSASFSVSFEATLVHGRIVAFDDFDLTVRPALDLGLGSGIPRSALRVEVDIGRWARISHLKILDTGFRISGWVRLSPAPPFRVIGSTPSELSTLNLAGANLRYKLDVGAMLAVLLGISGELPG